jgi:hypothetical protein
MGRGLSELQRSILQAVEDQGALSYAEICVGFFHWPSPGSPGQPLEPGHLYFSVADIGPKRYRSVYVSITRSCQRLARRGLVEWGFGSGVVMKPRRRRKANG